MHDDKSGDNLFVLQDTTCSACGKQANISVHRSGTQYFGTCGNCFSTFSLDKEYVDNLEQLRGQGVHKSESRPPQFELIPHEIRGWNWGAFLLTWIWGLAHGVWISLLCFIPFVNIVMWFVLGAKGNEWAWQKGKWLSIEHFKRTQRNWAWWGLGVWVCYIIVIVVIAIVPNLGSSHNDTKFKTDLEVMQLVTAVFYSDVHSGWKDVNGNDNTNEATSYTDNIWGRTKNDTVAGHYYPTAIASVSKHILVQSGTRFDPINQDNPIVLASGGIPATDFQIQAHAIWMGLLVNGAGYGTLYSGSDDRNWASPLQGDTSLYLNQIPDSAMAGNNYNGGSGPGGSYCWVVGSNGWVFGAYRGNDGYWYSGFNGNYP
jgi:hypothetical protein